LLFACEFGSGTVHPDVGLGHGVIGVPGEGDNVQETRVLADIRDTGTLKLINFDHPDSRIVPAPVLEFIHFLVLQPAIVESNFHLYGTQQF